MKIRLDDTNYHLNDKVSEEGRFLKEVYTELFKRFSSLSSFIDDSFNKYEHKYDDKERIEIVKKCIKATSKYIKDDVEDEIKEDKFYELLSFYLTNSFEIILENERHISLDRAYLYEPISIYTLYLLDVMMDECDSNLKSFKDEKTIYEVLLCNSLARTLKTSLISFALGDDVHGVALYRGAIELLMRLNYIDDNFNEFKRFTDINVILQNKKNGCVLPKDQVKILNDFLKEFNVNTSSCEQFLLYGWIKKANGKRIRSITEILPKEFQQLYHLSCEFIHEDYLADYDFVGLRKGSKSILAVLTSVLFELEVSVCCKFSQKVKEIHKKFKQIFNIN